MKLPQIRQDRANHFIYGFLIFIISNFFLQDYLSLLVVALVGLGKEVYDEYKYKGFDIIDFIFTLLSALIIVVSRLIN